MTENTLAAAPGDRAARSPRPVAAAARASVFPSRRWSMTSDALNRLVDELSALQRDIAFLAGEMVWEPGVVHVPTAHAARRLETLSLVLESADRVDDPDLAVIGRRATVREEDGATSSYALVYPGDGDPVRGWVSADSPLGRAILGCRAGDVVDVTAPAGRRSVTVVAID